MNHGTYIGRDYPYLTKGMGAKLKDHPTDRTKVLAQFDSKDARRNDVVQATGWHLYPRTDFQFDTYRFDVWSEGYRLNGDCAKATHHGTVTAGSFRDACDKVFNDMRHQADYDAKRLTLRRCKLFDNEQDARESYG